MISHLSLFLLLAFFAIFVSAFFYFTSPGVSTSLRMFSSASGIFAAGAVTFAVLVDFELARCDLKNAWIGSNLLLALTVVSLVTCFVTYTGPKFHHALHVAAIALIIGSFPLITIVAESERRLGLCAS